MFLKLQPYVEQSVAAQGNQKLAFRYFGPYKVTKRVGEVAYKLELPASSQVHPVVHVSQLKKHVLASQVQNDLAISSATSICTLQAVQILETAMILHGEATSSRVKVSWSRGSSLLTTWEDAADLCRRHPTAPAWGLAVLKRRG